MTTQSETRHYLVLDSFRGLCACFVALTHFNAVSLFSSVSMLSQGAIYVDFFFVLSGFVIFANYGDKLRHGYSMGKFILLRFGRLYPLHLCVLMGFIGIDFLQLILPLGGMTVYKPFSAPGEGLGDIIANLFLVHSLNVSKHLAFNVPSWSISTEFYAYILFAVILVYSGKYYRPLIIMFGTGSAIALYLLNGELYAKLDYGFLRCIFGFACGALIWEIFQGNYGRLLHIMSDRKRADIIEIVVMLAMIVYIQFFSQVGLLSMFAPLVFSLVIFVFSYEGGRISAALKWKPFVFVGALSYSIYMIHIFISGKFFSLSARLLESRSGMKLVTPGEGGFPVFGDNLFTGTLWEIFYLVVVIGCSYISYKLIEEPCRNYTRKLAKGETSFIGLKFSKAGT